MDKDIANMTTLCYIERNDKYLMLHRVKKEQDANKDKWIGIGGHFKENETPDECVVREVFEETGLRLATYRLRGIITFLSDEWPTEYMFLYTAKLDSEDSKLLGECPEGELEWVDRKKVYDLPIWEGDKEFFRLLDSESDFFQLKLRYVGEKLAECVKS